MCAQAEGLVVLDAGSGSIINVASISARIVNRPQVHAHYSVYLVSIPRYITG